MFHDSGTTTYCPQESCNSYVLSIAIVTFLRTANEIMQARHDSDCEVEASS